MANAQLNTPDKIGIIGYPAKHSLSPTFQQAAFNERNLHIQYEIWETHPDELESVVRLMRAPNILGANVTMPFKETIMPLLDSIHPSAELIGAVNTIVKANGLLIGHNTDGIGFVEALADLGFASKEKNILIIGAGGAARSIAFSLIQETPAKIIIANRDKSRAISPVSYTHLTLPPTPFV